MSRFERYAVYYAPPEASALAEFGGSWLGRDSAGRPLARPAVAGLDDETLARFTAEPARYGFHGTLKAPFRLEVPTASKTLEATVARLATTLAPARSGPLELTTIGSFLALCPTGDQAEVDALAGTLVRDLDHFRAPLTEEERARRRPERLNADQRAHLDRWGYPYVFDEFRFHLSLTGPLGSEDRARARDALAPLVAPFASAPFAIDEICLFGDPGGGKPFELISRHRLAGLDHPRDAAATDT